MSHFHSFVESEAGLVCRSCAATYAERWDRPQAEDRALHTFRIAADALFTEIQDLYLSGILDLPDEDDDEDPRRPLADACEAFRKARDSYAVEVSA